LEVVVSQSGRALRAKHTTPQQMQARGLKQVGRDVGGLVVGFTLGAPYWLRCNIGCCAPYLAALQYWLFGFQPTESRPRPPRHGLWMEQPSLCAVLGSVWWIDLIEFFCRAIILQS